MYLYFQVPNVLERLKLPRFIGIDIFFNQVALYHGVTQGDNSEIQNAVLFLKRKTLLNWKLEKKLFLGHLQAL